MRTRRERSARAQGPAPGLFERMVPSAITSSFQAELNPKTLAELLHTTCKAESRRHPVSNSSKVIALLTEFFGSAHSVLYPFLECRFFAADERRGWPALLLTLAVAMRAEPAEKLQLVLSITDSEGAGRLSLLAFKQIICAIEEDFIVCCRDYRTRDRKDLAGLARSTAKTKLSFFFNQQYNAWSDDRLAQVWLSHAEVLGLLARRPPAFAARFLPAGVSLHRFFCFTYEDDAALQSESRGYAEFAAKLHDLLSTAEVEECEEKEEAASTPSLPGTEPAEAVPQVLRLRMQTMFPPHFPSAQVAQRLLRGAQ